MPIKIKATKIQFCFIRLNLESYSRGSFRHFLCLFVCFFKISLKRSFCRAILQRGVMAVTVIQRTFWNLPPSARRISGAQPGLPLVSCLCRLQRPVCPDCSASSGSSKSFRMIKSHCALFVESFLRSGPGYDSVPETSCLGWTDINSCETSHRQMCPSRSCLISCLYHRRTPIKV